MANISKFDRTDVLEKAKNLFWQKGYLGTSTRELQTAINMRPGSIYAAFGSKADLFSAVLEHYALAFIHHVEEHVFNQADILGALKSLVQHIVLSPDQARPSEICMLIKTLSELDESHQEILALVRTLLNQVEETFVDILEQAKIQGSIAADADVKAAAKTLQINIIGWRAYLKASADSESIEQQIDQLFSQLRLGKQNA